MTFAKVWTYLRWPIAIIGLLLVVNYALPRLGDAASGMIEFDASGSILAPDEAGSETEADDPLDIPEAEIQASTLEPGTGPVTDGSAEPIADFTVNDTIADIDGTTLSISDDPGDALVVAFEIPQGNPACMEAVSLNMTVAESLSPVEIGVFPSGVDDPVEVVDNQAVDGDLRATQSPMAVALIEAPGVITFDLTTGFEEYFTHDFPADKPFVLTIAPTVEVATQGGASFVSANAEDDQVPTLLWTGTPDCPPVGADPTPTGGE